jgi:hypothetical protein
MASGQATLRLTRDEVSLVLAALDALAAQDAFTQSVQPAFSEQAVAAVTRTQAIDMLRAIVEQAR